jgi:hypothetical protein
VSLSLSLSVSRYNRKLLGCSGLVSFYAKRNQTTEEFWAPLYPREVLHVTLCINSNCLELVKANNFIKKTTL